MRDTQAIGKFVLLESVQAMDLMDGTAPKRMFEMCHDRKIPKGREKSSV
jgi:hypothetical protein